MRVWLVMTSCSWSSDSATVFALELSKWMERPMTRPGGSPPLVTLEFTQAPDTSNVD
jgi:hypothetical protein